MNGHAHKSATTPAPPAIDQSEAQRFLALLDPSTDEFTFSAFDDGPKPKRDELTKNCIHGTLDARLAHLADLNARGAGIFVMANAGDGKDRAKKNVTHVRAIWQDDDKQWQGDFPLQPSIVTQTSIDRFQRWWLVEGLTADEHKAIMERMVRDYGSDIGAKDLPRVLRLPGFLHRKREPNCLVRIIDASGKRYSRDEILAAFPPSERAEPAPYVPVAIEPGDDEDERLRSALAAIPADDREIWIHVGMALQDAYGEAGKGIWDQWSATCPAKFTTNGQARAWKSFTPGKGRTIRSTFWLAECCGWERPHDMAPVDEAIKIMCANLNLGRKARGATEPEIEVEAEAEAEDEQSNEYLSADFEDFPEALTYPGGLVGEMIDWITDTARRPNRAMAMAAALMVLGTAMGREWAGPTKSSTVLYALILAPTGAGKGHPLGQAARLMTRGGMADLLGPDDFQSANAMSNYLQKHPLSLSIMDEFGAFLGRITHRNASSFARDASALLRKMWPINFESYRTSEYAQRAHTVVNAPAFNIFGASVPDEFYAALRGSDVKNGFFNRFLVISVTSAAEDREPESPKMEVLEHLAEKLKFAMSRGRLYDHKRDPSHEIVPTMVPWGKGAKAVYEDMASEVDLRTGGDKAAKAFYVRAQEMAVRLATIVGFGRNTETPVVDSETMLWGAKVALWSTDQMFGQFKKYASENDTQSLAKEILRHVAEVQKSARDKRISHSKLLKKLDHKFKAHEVKSMVEMLLASGDLRHVETEPAPNGRKPVFYRV